VVNCRVRVDLLFFDILENLLVPRVSFLPTKVLAWNANEEYEALQLAFSFAYKHLQNHNSIIVFYSLCIDSRSNIMGLCKTYWMVKSK